MPCFPGKGFVKVWLSVITYQNDVTVSDCWYHQVQILLLCTTWIHQGVVKLIDHFICTSFHLIYQAFEAPIAKKLMNFKTMRGFEIIEGGLWSLIRSQEAKKCLVYKLELKCSFYSVFCIFFKDSIMKKIRLLLPQKQRQSTSCLWKTFCPKLWLATHYPSHAYKNWLRRPIRIRACWVPLVRFAHTLQH